MARQTPGLWFEYFSGPILSTAGVTVALVPGGFNLYLRYAAIATLTTIPSGTLIYLAVDGIPVLTLNPLRQAVESNFIEALPVTNAITMGTLTGSTGFPYNMLVTYFGDME